MSLSDYRKVLVTGASSGIGEAVVRRLTSHNLEVHALARRQDRLSELASATGCIPLALDLRDTDALYDTLQSTEYDVLINNAGVIGPDTTLDDDFSAEEFSATLAINSFAPLRISQAFLGSVSASRQKKIVVITSGLGSIQVAPEVPHPGPFFRPLLL